MAINSIFKRWNGSSFDEFKFASYDSDRLGGVLPSGYALSGDLDDLASKEYISSRSQNLITNGTGLLGDNTNFS
jgi:hypothetical protein